MLWLICDSAVKFVTPTKSCLMLPCKQYNNNKNAEHNIVVSWGKWVRQRGCKCEGKGQRANNIKSKSQKITIYILLIFYAYFDQNCWISAGRRKALLWGYCKWEREREEQEYKIKHKSQKTNKNQKTKAFQDSGLSGWWVQKGWNPLVFLVYDSPS